MRDPDHLIYFREEAGGLVMGGYERGCAPWALQDDGRGLDAIPADFNGRLLEEDWDRLEEIVANARMRVPVMDNVGVTRLINGPEAFTPDGEFCLGETEVRGLFVAAGFCAHGLAGAGGVGKAMAEWIVGGEPERDLWQMDVRRFGAHYRSPAYTVKRVREVYETYYDIKYPNHERQAGRPLRVSPAYDWHREHGAAFGEKSGWERVNWYAANEAAGDAVAAPARLGRACTGRRRSAPSTRPAARPPRCSTRRRSRRSRSAARAPRSCSSGCATTTSRARSAGSRTRRCSTRAAGSSATSRSRGWPRTGSASSPAPRSAATTSPGSPRTRGDGVRVEDVTSRWACPGCGGRARATCSPPRAPTTCRSRT